MEPYQEGREIIWTKLYIYTATWENPERSIFDIHLICVHPYSHSSLQFLLTRGLYAFIPVNLHIVFPESYSVHFPSKC